MKKCPFCGSEIVDKAVFCVHCGSYLEDKKDELDNENYTICPKCQNKCIKDAVICVECGETLVKRETRKEGMGLKIIAIIIFVIDIVSSALVVVGNFYYGYTSLYSTVVIPAIVSMVTAIMIIVGLSSNKNKKIIGVAYILEIVKNLMLFLINVYSSNINITFSKVFLTVVTSFIITNLEGILMAVIFLSEKTVLKKLWFIPAVFCVMSLVISNWGNMGAIISNPLFLIIEIAQFIVLGLTLKNDINKKQKAIK